MAIKKVQIVPKAAPKWAIGTATVLASIAASLVAVYTIARPEVAKYVENQGIEIKEELELKKSTTAGILGILATNSKQIGELSATLQRTTERLGEVEKELALAQLKLENCQKSKGTK